jgi:hypothetical protein
MSRIKSGKTWLTATVSTGWRGDQGTPLRLPADILSSDTEKAGVFKVKKPPVYYGRVLFEDGSPARIEREPWPGASIRVDVPAGSGELDAEGYFSMCLTDSLLAALKKEKRGFGIYYPQEERGRSRSVAKYDASLLSTEKEKAGVLKIRKHVYHFETELVASGSLVGKPLPSMKDIDVAFRSKKAKGKMILVCFWDMNQRPSRAALRELAKQAKKLAGLRVAVVGINAGDAKKETVEAWCKKYKVTFPVGCIRGDAKKVQFAWGAKGLPWLILTNRKHVVSAEGFDLAELEATVKRVVAGENR